MDSKTRAKLCQTRRWRIRKKVFGSKVRPRMSVRFTGQHIYVQFIDDAAGTTLAAASTRPAKKPASPGKDRMAANKAGAAKLGVIAAQLALDKGISNVVFDRSGAQYHGKVKALADAAREAGLKF